MNIGTKIRKIRGEKGLSQEVLAEKLNISQGTLSNIESNKSKPDIDFLNKIANVFEIDIYDLIGDKKLKQIYKDNSVGYTAENQVFNLSEKIIEQYEIRLKEKDEIIALLREENLKLKNI